MKHVQTPLLNIALEGAGPAAVNRCCCSTGGRTLRADGVLSRLDCKKMAGAPSRRTCVVRSPQISCWPKLRVSATAWLSPRMPLILRRLLDEAEFAKTAETFTSKDWHITLNAYRSRWRSGEAWDQRYDALLARLREIESLAVPTLMIQGLADNCDPPSESEGLEKYFTSRYLRITLEGVGHFPHRESPDRVAATLLDHLNQ